MGVGTVFFFFFFFKKHSCAALFRGGKNTAVAHSKSSTNVYWIDRRLIVLHSLSQALCSSVSINVHVHSHVRLFGTPWTIAHQAPLSMGFPRQEYCSGLPFPLPGESSQTRIKPDSSPLEPCLQVTFSLFCRRQKMAWLFLFTVCKFTVSPRHPWLSLSGSPVVPKWQNHLCAYLS